MDIRLLISQADSTGLKVALAKDPSLANQPIALLDNDAVAHPLHRICDGVFSKRYTEDQAFQMAKIFLAAGADVNGVELINKKDSPLVAAASLHADQLALLYIEHSAALGHPGCHGGTALHWAAWCGRDVVVRRLLEFPVDINRKCIDFKSTPLFWAVHGHKFGGEDNRHHQAECVRLLLSHGANPAIPNFEGYLPKQLLGEADSEFIGLLP
jgi:uncharacterized protein